MKSNELILILDFGGQYNQLIARRVRECNVYSEVVPYDISLEKIKEKNPKGIIFTVGPANVYTEVVPYDISLEKIKEKKSKRNHFHRRTCKCILRRFSKMC